MKRFQIGKPAGLGLLSSLPSRNLEQPSSKERTRKKEERKETKRKEKKKNKHSSQIFLRSGNCDTIWPLKARPVPYQQMPSYEYTAGHVKPIDNTLDFLIVYR